MIGVGLHETVLHVGDEPRVVSFPSSPYESSPQQYALPVVVTPQV
jgi:hypothetical protein